MTVGEFLIVNDTETIVSIIVAIAFPWTLLFLDVTDRLFKEKEVAEWFFGLFGWGLLKYPNAKVWVKGPRGKAEYKKVVDEFVSSLPNVTYYKFTFRYSD